MSERTDRRLSADSHPGRPRYPPTRHPSEAPPHDPQPTPSSPSSPILAIVAGGYLAYDNVLRGDAVAPLALPSAAPSRRGERPPDAAAGAASAAPSTRRSTWTADGSVAGTWTVTDGSEAGYRVREQLANLPAESDAVGRTSDVTGTHHARRQPATARS